MYKSMSAINLNEGSNDKGTVLCHGGGKLDKMGLEIEPRKISRIYK